MAAVLVHIDLDGDRPHASSLAALAAGRHIASSWGATLYAALIAHNTSEKRSPDSTAQVVSAGSVPGIDEIENELAHGGADKVIVAMTDAPIVPLWGAVGSAWQGILDHLRPRLVLFGADSPSGIELAPRTGARIGARLLMRARALGGDEVELRDRDGGYARLADGGATVALIGHAEIAPAGDADVDLAVLALPGGGDPRIELVSVQTVDVAASGRAIVALGKDVAADPAIVESARRLAALLGAQLLDASVERTTPVAPELCVMIGAAQLDIAGATSVIRIGAQPSKSVDGALPGDIAKSLAELIERLERS